MDTTIDTTNMCSHGTVVACGSVTGSIVLRDYRTGLQADHMMRAHMGPIVSMDLHNDLLVSAGLVERHGSMIYETVIKVGQCALRSFFSIALDKVAVTLHLSSSLVWF